MSSLYLSTGRKPSQLTRKVARLLSLILQAKYENRGKKSVDEVCIRAEKFGCQKVAFIYEKKGNPASIEFFDEEKGWLPEIISISGIYLPKRKGKKRIPPSIQLICEGSEGLAMRELLGVEGEAEGIASPLVGVLSEKGLAFTSFDERILEIKGKLGRIAHKNAEK
ncbi:MAG: hypothetical protein ABH863_04450 [Candidatus Micrarchaeota archaeon]